MSRRIQHLLLAGCLAVGLLHLPTALRSLELGLRGPYADEAMGAARVAGRHVAPDAATGAATDGAVGVATAAPPVTTAPVASLPGAGAREAHALLAGL